MKGSIDITVLIAAVGPMILLMIFASFFIAEENVKTSLYADVSFNENRYQAGTAHSIILNDTVRKRIGFFQYQDDDKQKEWNRSVSLYAERVLEPQSEVYSFRAIEGDVEIKSDIYGQDYRFSSYVASPSRDMVKARTGLGASRGGPN